MAAKKTILLLVLVLVIIGVVLMAGWKKTGLISPVSKLSVQTVNVAAPTPVPEPTSIPSPSAPSPSPDSIGASPIPLPDPLVYGPCRIIPVLMYHHIQPKEEAQAKKQLSISVNNDVFASQMAYLASRGYTALTPDQFLQGVASGVQGRSILLTFDDAYEDFYKYAYPELVKNNLRATVFVPTGLVGNSDYMNWSQISEIKSSGLVTFANHTWSHKNMGAASEQTIRYEISTAKTQLEEHGLGPVTSFAYPYGTENLKVDSIMKEMGITSAFTTVPGSYQCAKLPYDFRRTRIGNSPLSSYGL